MYFFVFHFSTHEWKLTTLINALRPEQNVHQFADDIFKYIILNRNNFILIKISLTIPKGLVDKPSLIHILAWCQTDNKPLSELMVSFTNIYVTQPQSTDCL